MGAAADDLAEKKRRQEATQEEQRQNERKYLQSPSEQEFETKVAAPIRQYREEQDAYDKAGQAAKDLKTKRASEGKIRY